MTHKIILGPKLTIKCKKKAETRQVQKKKSALM